MAHSLMTERAPQTQDKYILRMPDGMRDQLKDAAKKSGRSLNAEIVHRLANTLHFPRFEDAGFDFGFGFDEELNMALHLKAAANDRTIAQEIAFRLQQSLMSPNSLYEELESQAWTAKRDLNDMMRLFMQMTPEERRVLEERADIVERAKEWSISSKQLAKWTALHRIGGKGRTVLSKATVDYSSLLPRVRNGQTGETVSETKHDAEGVANRPDPEQTSQQDEPGDVDV